MNQTSYLIAVLEYEIFLGGYDREQATCNLRLLSIFQSKNAGSH